MPGLSAARPSATAPGQVQVTVQKRIRGAGAGALSLHFIGANNTRSTASSGLPKAVSALGTVQNSGTWAENGASGAYNAAYDVWFSTAAEAIRRHPPQVAAI